MTISDTWKTCKLYDSTAQGRDFVVQHPETSELFEGYFSDKEVAIATITTDGNDLKFIGKYADLQKITETTVNVYFSRLPHPRNPLIAV